MKFLFVILLLLPVTVRTNAQVRITWPNTDTLTGGPCNNFHPSIPHNVQPYSYPNDILWIVYERRTPLTSDIVARRYQLRQHQWDDPEFAISPAPADSLQLLPDIGEARYFSDGYRGLMIAGWQRWDGHHWQIWYSAVADTSTSWSPPVQVTADSADNTGVQVRPGADSVLVLVWRRDSALVAMTVSPASKGNVDTVGFSKSATFDFDVDYYWGRWDALWMVSSRQVGMNSVESGSSPNWPNPDMQSFGIDLQKPRFYGGPFAFDRVLCETIEGRNSRIMLASPVPSRSDTLVADSIAELANSRGYLVPRTTNTREASSSSALPSASWIRLDAFVYERNSVSDSSLIFVAENSFDTVRSAGHNREPVLSSATKGYGTDSLYTVWESNRSGRAHIYGRWTRVSLPTACPSPTVPVSSELLQNYPNPFNPITHIQFSIGKRQLTNVNLFDLLGRKVATLVSEVKEPGSYTVEFNGSNLASGVYFCRLQSGTYVQTRKLLLIR